MDIKEIALNVADSLRNKIDGISHMQSNQGLVRFAEALIAELAKQNEPVYAFRRKGLDDFCTCDKRRFDELSQKTTLFEVRVFYHSPPTAEQIANETAEAIAEYCRNQDHYCLATEIESGAWREFK